jgi:hypothetical protein
MNFFYHFKILLKHEINEKMKCEKTEDSEIKLFFFKLFKKKKKKISFVKNTENTNFVKEIKYFFFRNLYIYSQKFNKSKLYINFFINYNNKVSIVDKIYLLNNEIMLNITTYLGEKFTIKKNQILNQILYLRKNYYISLNEPNWLI